MLVTAPAVGLDGVFIGVIAFEVDMSSIYKIIQEVTGLGNTGEVLLGKKIGNGVIFLNPLRHDPEAALRKSITFGGEIAGPVQEAVQGRNGAGLLIDYRGKKVIAAWRHIPSLDWGMVAKIDAEEAFADVMKVRNLVVMILILVFILCGIMALLIARSISEPIKKLTRGAEIVGSGNLDYKVETDLNDEIGELSRTFDKMTRDLKSITASRDELNREIVVRKLAEEDLQKALSELERSNRELEQFAYVASHDLQEPLRMVASYVRLLEKKYRGQLDEKADQYIHFAVDGALRMQKLIEGLLAYARIGRGGEFMPVDTSDVVSRVVSDLSESLQESHAVVTKDDLPTVTGDETLLMQLFQNLIRNGVKFRRPEVPPQVHISAKKEGKEWVFSVRDNGIGIDQAYAERIFLIFQRLHTREEYPGTGIGLALCKKIVERHHGRIWVESAPGEGATFFFTIPE
jgi:signal transduction histidine kinase